MVRSNWGRKRRGNSAGGLRAARIDSLDNDLGSGLIVYSQKMTVAAMQMADMKVWAHRS